MRFAHLKRILKLGRLRLRGPQGAQDEFVLAAIAQNLRRLASLVARPPPAQALCIAQPLSCVECVRIGGSRPVFREEPAEPSIANSRLLQQNRPRIRPRANPPCKPLRVSVKIAATRRGARRPGHPEKTV